MVYLKKKYKKKHKHTQITWILFGFSVVLNEVVSGVYFEYIVSDIHILQSTKFDLYKPLYYRINM